MRMRCVVGGGGVLLEFVYRLCKYVIMSCVIQHMIRA